MLYVASLPTGILSFYAHIFFKNSLAGFFLMLFICLILKIAFSYFYNIKENWNYWFEKVGIGMFLLLSFIVWTIAFNIIGGL
ncbi:MAG: hypothetical protein QXN00_00015 [Candidatus Aenigmatarchaeota archaeon]